MDGRTSPGRFLAYLLAENDMTVKSLCLKSGLAQRENWSLLFDPKPVTPVIAEKLGRVFTLAGSGTSDRPYGSSGVRASFYTVAAIHHKAVC